MSLVKDGELTEAPHGDLTDRSWNFAEGAKERHLIREGVAVFFGMVCQWDGHKELEIWHSGFGDIQR